MVAGAAGRSSPEVVLEALHLSVVGGLYERKTQQVSKSAGRWCKDTVFLFMHLFGSPCYVGDVYLYCVLKASEVRMTVCVIIFVV